MKQTQRGAARRRKASAGSLWIPIVVGLILVAVVAGLIVSIESRGPDAAALPNATAGPQPTSQLPYPDVPRITVEDAAARLEAGEAVLIDVRSQESFNSLHATGAISLPEDQVPDSLDELPRDKDIILYCT